MMAPQVNDVVRFKFHIDYIPPSGTHGVVIETRPAREKSRVQWVHGRCGWVSNKNLVIVQRAN